MARFQFGGSVLIVKYLCDNNGRPYYQRRIPDDLRVRFGKKKLSIPLDPAQGAPAIQVQRLAKSHDALFKALRQDPNLSMTEEKLAALAILQQFGLEPGVGQQRLDPRFDEAAQYDDQPFLSEFHDELSELLRSGKFTNAHRLAYKALEGPLPILLSEMLPIYFEHHRRGAESVWKKKQEQYWQKLVHYFGDISALSVDREKARAYRSHRESLGLKSQSVQKDLNIVRAVFEVCIREVPLKMTNPFEGLSATAHGQDAKRREPFSLDELQRLVSAALHRSDDIRRIALACALTGARIGEIVGLRKCDCKFDVRVPYVEFVEYPNRRLKTANSVRKVPVVVPLRAELEKQLEEDTNSEALFPRYNRLEALLNASGASAAVNKWIRDDLGLHKTAHSLRHTMADLLREAGVTEDLREELLGHGRQKSADTYGLGRSLNLKIDALNAALTGLRF